MKTFLDLASLGLGDKINLENADTVIVPFGYEGTVTFGRGTKRGPEALIEASSQVETFDDELLDDIQNQIKIWTFKQPSLPRNPERACSLLQKIISELIQKNKFPVIVGGEHTLSYGVVNSLKDFYKDVSILVFDAHLDLGDQWSKSSFTHASWLKYSLQLKNIKKATLIGIRNFNKLEYSFWQNNPERVKVFLAKDLKSWNVEEIISSLLGNVYISFDVDAFDSSLMPSTGTPEPGGLFWYDVLPILRAVCGQKNVVGMDLVELAPIKGLHAPDFLAAKLLTKMILYKFRAKQLKETFGN